MVSICASGAPQDYFAAGISGKSDVYVSQANQASAMNHSLKATCDSVPCHTSSELYHSSQPLICSHDKVSKVAISHSGANFPPSTPLSIVIMPRRLSTVYSVSQAFPLIEYIEADPFPTFRMEFSHHHQISQAKLLGKSRTT